MRPIAFALIATLFAVSTATADQPATQPADPATLIAQYRQLIRTRKALVSIDGDLHPIENLDDQLAAVRKSLQSAADEWWKTHSAKDLPAASDDQLLILLPRTPSGMEGLPDNDHDAAAIAEAITRPSFLYIVQNCEYWPSLAKINDDQLEWLWDESLAAGASYRNRDAPAHAGIACVVMVAVRHQQSTSASAADH